MIMEDKYSLVYMTVNMIILLLLYYLIHLYYIFFNNFLLTRQRLKRLYFLIFPVLVKEQFSFRFRRCTEPNPEDRRSEGIRIAIDANQFQMFIVFINLDQTRLTFHI